MLYEVITSGLTVEGMSAAMTVIKPSMGYIFGDLSLIKWLALGILEKPGRQKLSVLIQAFNAGVFRQIERANRITSYNVCYTKLLRCSFS